MLCHAEPPARLLALVADALAACRRTAVPDCAPRDLATTWRAQPQYCDPYFAVRLSSVAIDTPPLYERGASNLLVPEHGALALQPLRASAYQARLSAVASPDTVAYSTRVYMNGNLPYE